MRYSSLLLLSQNPEFITQPKLPQTTYIVYSLLINVPSRSTNLLYKTKEKYTQVQNIFPLNHKFNRENLTQTLNFIEV